MSNWTKELDEAAILATKKGHWHTVLFVLLCGYAAIPSAFLVFAQIFTNATPDHWCAPSPEVQALGLPEEMIRNLTIPLKTQNESFHSCFMYSLDSRILKSELVKIMENREHQVIYGKLRHDSQEHWLEQAILLARSPSPGPCTHGWQYSQDLYTNTLVTEYNLVCDNDWWPSTSNTLFWTGSVFGNLLFGWMSDKFGRRFTILVMISVEVPLSIMWTFCTDYRLYTVMRVIGGMFFPAMYQQPYILALEVMPPKRRSNTGIVIGMLFATGVCILALLAYGLRAWFTLSLATSLPFVLLFSYFWIIPESPRWLIGKGRIEDAEKVYRELANKNGIFLPAGFLQDLLHKTLEERETILPNGNAFLENRPNNANKGEIKDMYSLQVNSDILEDNLKKNIEEDRRKDIINEEGLVSNAVTNKIPNTSLFHIFRYPVLRRNFLLLTYNWTVLGAVYNSLSYNTPNLGVDVYIAFFIGGLVEIPSYYIALKYMDRFGRTKVNFMFCCIGGIACLSCAFVPLSLPWLTVCLAMFGRMCSAAAFAVMNVMVGEIFPTVIRAQTMGISSFIAGTGLLLCPYFIYLGVYYRPLPLVLNGIFCITSAVATVFLPETLQQPLPQTLEDGESFGKRPNVFVRRREREIND